ncbi:MAG TPA: DUF4124 domain-containing protein [Halothiobacillaceae bacterium]|nr:DUF4124 domain-containing protein [Halothiobacillaceae bacterium]
MKIGLNARIRQGTYTPVVSARRFGLGLALVLAMGSAAASGIYSYTDERGNIVFTDEPRDGAKPVTVDPPPPIPLRQLDLPTPAPVTPPDPPAMHDKTAQVAPPPNVPAQPPAGLPTPPESTQRPVERVEHGHGIWTETTTRPPTRQSALAVPAHDLTEPVVDMNKSQTPTGHYARFAIARPTEKSVVLGAGGTLLVELELDPELDRGAGDRIEVLVDGVKRIQGSTGLRHLISGVAAGERQIRARVVRGDQVIHQTPIHTFSAENP